MTDRTTEAFARFVIEEVRDAAIASCDSYLDSRSRAPIATRWGDGMTDEGRRAIRLAIPDIVDETIFHLLNRGFDQGELSTLLRNVGGELAQLAESGELSGAYLIDWRERSTQRRHDDLT